MSNKEIFQYFITAIIVIVIISFLSSLKTPDQKLNSLDYPIILIGESDLGSVTLKDNNGKYLTINYDYVIAINLSNSYEPGDTIR